MKTTVPALRWLIIASVLVSVMVSAQAWDAEPAAPGECVDNAVKRGLETSKRTSMMLDLKDLGGEIRLTGLFRQLGSLLL